jgi:hypothetical protein
MKQTAVEWLLNEIDMQYPEINLRRKEWMVDKAKEMEKEQMFKCKGNNDNGCFMESPGHDCGCFKRIQQEEPKQLTDLEIAMKLEEIDREEYKQETLEEEAEKYSREVWGVYYDDVHPDIAITQTQGEISVKDFSRGAKWQQEQDKKMYSEEEMIKILISYLHYLTTNDNRTSEEWFKQFKKK